MTRDEILNMLAGRELDALVAEKVMGEAQPIYVHPNLHLEYPEKSTAGNWYCYNIFEHGDICEWHPKPFSTNISDAWEVVEKLRLYVMPFGSKDWCVSKKRNSRGVFENIVVDDTAPPAICRAALLTVVESEK